MFFSKRKTGFLACFVNNKKQLTVDCRYCFVFATFFDKETRSFGTCFFLDTRTTLRVQALASQDHTGKTGQAGSRSIPATELCLKRHERPDRVILQTSEQKTCAGKTFQTRRSLRRLLVIALYIPTFKMRNMSSHQKARKALPDSFFLWKQAAGPAGKSAFCRVWDFGHAAAWRTT